jgi:uncharacterized protein (TIGR00369 family)
MPSRTYSWEDPLEALEGAAGLDGLGHLSAIVAGELPPPPIARLLDMDISLVEPGRVVFTCEPAEWMYNPIGSVHGGVAATLLDSAMGCAVQSKLPAGVMYTTSDLQVRYVRPMSTTTGRVQAEGVVVHVGRRVATAEGRITSEDGKLLASATTGCLILGPS